MTTYDIAKLAEAIAGIVHYAERKRMARMVGALAASTNVHFDWSKWATGCNVKLDEVKNG